jgi:drug/metabolite transporter (DMT)-like permease
MNIRAYLYLTLCTLFWSGNFIVGKVATLFEIPPLTLNFYRWFLAFLILCPFTLKGVIMNFEEIKKNFLVLIIMGFTSISVFNSVVYYSLNYTQVLNGVLMISTIPVFIIFFSGLFKTESIRIYQIIGVVISLLGVISIITKLDLSLLLSLKLNKGDLWMLVAMISWTTYSLLLGKKKVKLEPFIFLQTIIIIGLLFLFPMYIAEVLVGKKITLNIPVLMTIGYVVFFAGIGAYTFWNAAIKLIGPSRSGVFLHLMPIFSSLMAVFLLGEQFYFHHIVGTLLIISGILLSSKKTI